MQRPRSRFDPQHGRRKRRLLDPVKAMVASAVQHHLITDPAARPALVPQPDDVESVTAVAISETETMVRVTFLDKPTRYFTVSLRESPDKI